MNLRALANELIQAVGKPGHVEARVEELLSQRLGNDAAVVDWAQRRLAVLLEVWDRFDDTAKRQVVRDIERSLDRESNPKLKGSA